MKKPFLPIITICIAYAMVRCHIGEGRPLMEFPSHVLNKALSFGSMLLIGLSFVLKRRSYGKTIKRNLALSGFGMALIHVIISISIFSKERYPTLYTGEELNIIGELVFLFGILSLCIFFLPFLASFNLVGVNFYKQHSKEIFKLTYLAFTFSILHVLIIGIESWFKWETWPLHLPPISLIAFVISSSTLFTKLLRLYNRRKPHTNDSSVEPL